ncbi:MAG: S8 family peptidase [Anaerolineae bacterium]|nr:S8 family peptidase [Anaerolineae bacterium]
MKINRFSPKILLITVFSLLLVVAWGAASGSAQGPVVQGPPPVVTPEIVPGEIIVKFQADVGRLGAQNSLRAEGLRPLEISPETGLMRVEVKPGQESQVIAELLARGDVAYATYNYKIYALGDPNDPYYNPPYNLQWALKNAQDHDIDAPEAWDIHTGGSGVTIAVIDTGVDLDHPDLQAKIVAGWDYVNNDSLADDDHGHGTHVAGIAAASGNNGIGIAGVSWGARVMPLKVLDSAGNGDIYNLALAIRYAADYGAKIINMSLGASCGLDWSSVEDEINYARGKGVLLVAAAGNSGSTPVLCPGGLNGVVAVGATDSGDSRAYYSNYGAALDVAAPGSGIYSTYYGGGYTTMSGTSMASPHVAGLAALLRSYAPGMTSSEVEALIKQTADDLGSAGWDQYYGYGRINARRALERIALQISPAQPVLFIDDDPGVASSQVRVITPNSEPINWSASISPTVSWLTLSPPTSGSVSSTSTNQFITFNATKPQGGYDLYPATLVLTGTTGSGVTVGPIITQVQLHYVPEVKTLYFPVFFK